MAPRRGPRHAGPHISSRRLVSVAFVLILQFAPSLSRVDDINLSFGGLGPQDASKPDDANNIKEWKEWHATIGGIPKVQMSRPEKLQFLLPMLTKLMKDKPVYTGYTSLNHALGCEGPGRGAVKPVDFATKVHTMYPTISYSDAFEIGSLFTSSHQSRVGCGPFFDAAAGRPCAVARAQLILKVFSGFKMDPVPLSKIKAVFKGDATAAADLALNLPAGSGADPMVSSLDFLRYYSIVASTNADANSFEALMNTQYPGFAKT